MLRELGHEPSVVGVARMYASIASVLVIDPLDAHLSDAVEAAGMRCVVTPSVMSTPQIARELAVTHARLGGRLLTGPGQPVAQRGPRRPSEMDARPHGRDREPREIVRTRRGEGR